MKALIWMLIFIGFIVAGLRIGFANLGQFKNPIESWVATEVVPGLEFGDIRGDWNWVSPVFELDHAVITLPGRSKPIVIDTMAIEFDIWGSLIFSTPVVREVTGTIAEINIRKDSQKHWWINDIKLVADKASAAASNFEDLLASIPHYMHLELNRLNIENEISGQSHSIDNISADIETHGDATHLQLLAKLPAQLGSSLEVKSILQGDTGIIYLHSQQLKLAPIAALLGLSQDTSQRIEAGGEIWVNLKAHQIHAITASIDRLAVDGKRFPTLHSRLRLSGAQHPRHIEGWLESVELQPITELGRNYLPAEFSDKLVRSQLQGRIAGVVFSAQLGDWQSLELSARAIDISSKNVGSLPGIDKMSADVVYGRQNARLSLKAEQLALDFGEQFRAPLQVDRFHSEVRASFTPQGMVLTVPEFSAVNQDIKVAGRLRLETDQESDAAFFFIRAAYKDGDGSQKSKYLPIKLLPPRALKWVDQGIRSARIPSGMVMFHGRLESIKTLAKNQSGEFYAGFEVNNAEVMFDPAWEVAHNGNGKVLFHNLGMDIKLDSVSYADVDNARAEISIPTFLDTAVRVDVNAGTSTERALRLWLATPVGEDYREIGKSLQDPGGRVDANIKLSIPVENKKLAEQIRVKLNFDNAAIDAPRWGVKLKKIVGDVLVTNHAVSSSGIKAEFYGDPISVDINTNEVKRLTYVKAGGLIETQHLLNRLPQALFQAVEGKSQWHVDFAIANQKLTGSQPVLKITANSSLQGTAIHLPAPLQKKHGAKRRVKVTFKIHADGDADFLAAYGAQVKTRGRLSNTGNKDLQLAGLDIILGTLFKPKQAKGIHLYGKLRKLPLDEWIVFHQSQAARQQEGRASMLEILQSVDLNVAELSLFGHRISNTAFKLQQSARGYNGSIDSSVTRGNFHFPQHSSVQNPITLDLEYFRFAQGLESNQGAGLLPTDMPNLQLSSKEFAYDGRTVTDLKLDTSVDNGVMLIDSLVFRRDNVEFKFNGHWLFDPPMKQHFTQLYGSIKGKRFGQAIAELGFGDTIHNGKIAFKGEISWPDALFNPQWDTVSGEGKFKLEDGILKDIEPGSGRFVGLFSLNVLPRRLGLDFSDVLFEGMEFDEIEGNLMLVGQSLHTSNIKLDGPAAKISIIGSTGLRERDYDQLIHVVPNIRYVLPTMGFLLGGGAGVLGWAVIQNMFKSSIDESVEVKYSLTGSWDEPVLKVLNKPLKADIKKPVTPRDNEK
ncbi:MAG: hypothetical protein GY784_06680 [Gammaproteobacteria bacterium]|nr:hypothetical protein [Gammaproteobacteria bacterium]